MPCGMQAEHHAATAAELGGGAVVEQCHKLQADLMTCQQVGWLGPLGCLAAHASHDVLKLAFGAWQRLHLLHG